MEGWRERERGRERERARESDKINRYKITAEWKDRHSKKNTIGNRHFTEGKKVEYVLSWIFKLF